MNPLTTKAPTGPVARELAPAGLRSSPKPCHPNSSRHTAYTGSTAAAQPNGDESPHHESTPLPVARELAPAGLRSSPKPCHPNSSRHTACTGFATAAQPNGSKLPRHKMQSCHQPCGEGMNPPTTKAATLPVARELAPAGLRSSPKPCHPNSSRHTACTGFATAAQPNGSKLPRHKMQSRHQSCGEGIHPRWAAQRPQTLPPQFIQTHRIHRLCDCCAAERG